MTDSLQTLLERLQNADGPDREIDAEFFRMLGYVKKTSDKWQIPTSPKPTYVETWRTPDGRELCPFYEDGGTFSGKGSDIPPHYTASLDAAVALVEKVLPGWFMTLSQYENGAYVQIRRHPRKVKSCDFDSDGSTPALALLTAMTKALIAEQE